MIEAPTGHDFLTWPRQKQLKWLRDLAVGSLERMATYEDVIQTLLRRIDDLEEQLREERNNPEPEQGKLWAN